MPWTSSDAAPAPTAIDQDGAEVSFADVYKSGITLVYFYPKADTPGCTAEACSLRDSYADLTAKGIQVIGVSEDKTEAQKKFQDKYKLPFTLIADSDSAVAKAFGVPTPMGGIAKRQSFHHQRRQNRVARQKRIDGKAGGRCARGGGKSAAAK